METLLPWVIASVGLAAAVLAFLHGRQQATRIRTLEAARDAMAETARAAEKRFEGKVRENRKRGEELGELRKRIDKAKKRAARAQDEQKGEGARIRQLEEQLRIAEADRRAALSELERTAGAGASAPAPAVAAPVAPSPAPAPGPTPEQLEALKSLTQRAEEAEGRMAALEAELRTAAHEAARYRKKSRSLETAYTAQHGELEAKRDRLRALQEEVERLRALRAGLAASGGTAAEPSEVVEESADAATDEAAALTPVADPS